MVTVLLDLPPGVLRVRLEAVLTRHAVFSVVNQGAAGRPDVTVTTTQTCNPRRCATLCRSGLRVVVLAATPDHDEELAYRQAGAARYLAMGPESMSIADIPIEVVGDS